MSAPRTRGQLSDPRFLGLHDHAGWCFDGDHFDEVALPYLEEGLRRKELVCHLSDDPDPGRLRPLGNVDSLVARGSLRVARVDLAYDGEPSTLAARLGDFVATARARGFPAVRVATDISGIVARVGADGWLARERAADVAIAGQPVVALCAYDRRIVDATSRLALASVHPVFSAGQDDPPFRLFFDDGALQLSGSVDALSAPCFSMALRSSLGERVVLDLSTTDFLDHSALRVLHAVAADGVPVVLRRARPVHRRLWALLGLTPVDLRFDDRAGWR